MSGSGEQKQQPTALAGDSICADDVLSRPTTNRTRGATHILAHPDAAGLHGAQTVPSPFCQGDVTQRSDTNGNRMLIRHIV